MRHGRVLMRLAAVCAVLGITLSVAGFCMGGRLTNIHVYWDHGGPRVEYREMGTDAASISVPSVEQIPDVFDVPDVPDVEDPDDILEDIIDEGAQATENNSGGRAIPTGEVRKLTVECKGAGGGSSAPTVEITTGDGWSVVGDSSIVFTSEADDEDGEWTITAKQKGKLYSGGILQITVPSDYPLEELDLTVGACSLYAEGLECNKADITVGAGSITLSDFTCRKESDWEIGAGSLYIDNGILRGTVEIECGMGSVNMGLDRPISVGYDIETGMGSVTIDGSEYSGMAVAKSSGPKAKDAALYFDIECGMGSVDISF